MNVVIILSITVYGWRELSRIILRMLRIIHVYYKDFEDYPKDNFVDVEDYLGVYGEDNRVIQCGCGVTFRNTVLMWSIIQDYSVNIENYQRIHCMNVD